MRANLLTHGDYNVIVVDWGGGSALPYSQATANTRLVGLEIAFLSRTLVVRHRNKTIHAKKNNHTDQTF